MRLTLQNALMTTADLAVQNIPDERDTDGDSEQINTIKNQKRSIALVQKLSDLYDREERLTKLGDLLIDACQLKKKANGRVELAGGDKTPLGVARTLLAVIEDHLKT